MLALAEIISMEQEIQRQNEAGDGLLDIPLNLLRGLANDSDCDHATGLTDYGTLYYASDGEPQASDRLTVRFFYCPFCGARLQKAHCGELHEQCKCSGGE